MAPQRSSQHTPVHWPTGTTALPSSPPITSRSSTPVSRSTGLRENWVRLRQYASDRSQPVQRYPTEVLRGILAAGGYLDSRHVRAGEVMCGTIKSSTGDHLGQPRRRRGIIR